jgi:single-strand DNA-binding protein
LAKGINKQILVGNLGRDPETKYTPKGTTVTKFSVAVGERTKSQDGEWQDHTEWFNCVAFGKSAEILEQYAKKGHSIYIEGKSRTRSWEDKESGQKKYMTEVIIDDFAFLSGGNGSGGKREQNTASSRPIDDNDIPF